MALTYKVDIFYAINVIIIKGWLAGIITFKYPEILVKSPQQRLYHLEIDCSVKGKCGTN